MKLLIVTQKIDKGDSVLGFMHAWVEEFARACERVTVICLGKGDYSFKENVKVLSLGKETKPSRLRYIFNFYKFIIRERKNYTHVLVHMNPEYVVMGGLCWRLWGKRIGLWYAHGHVPFWLRLAEPLTHIVFASTKSGFRLPSKKLNVIGQGIDVDWFKPGRKTKSDLFRIISIGRISPVKDYETLIRAVRSLPTPIRGRVHVDIIGGAGTRSQEKYFDDLKVQVRENNLEEIVDFSGAVANKDIVGILQSSDLFVNMSRTGSLDKAMLEAMASELPVLTCNEAMLEVLAPHKERLMYKKGDHRALAQKIEEFATMEESEMQSLSQALRKIVIRDHSLDRFVKEIIRRLSKT